MSGATLGGDVILTFRRGLDALRILLFTKENNDDNDYIFYLFRTFLGTQIRPATRHQTGIKNKTKYKSKVRLKHLKAYQRKCRKRDREVRGVTCLKKTTFYFLSYFL